MNGPSEEQSKQPAVTAEQQQQVIIAELRRKLAEVEACHGDLIFRYEALQKTVGVFGRRIRELGLELKRYKEQERREQRKARSSQEENQDKVRDAFDSEEDQDETRTNQEEARDSVPASSH